MVNFVPKTNASSSRSNGEPLLWCKVRTQLPKVTAGTLVLLEEQSDVAMMKHMKEKHKSLHKYLERELLLCNPLFASLFVISFSKIKRKEKKTTFGAWDTATLFNAILLEVNERLISSKQQLLSANGLRGQCCMQCCGGHVHKNSDSSKMKRESGVVVENFLISNSDSFVWNHFGCLQTKSEDGAFELYLRDDSKQYDSNATGSDARNAPPWSPITRFPCCHQNSLLYLVMGGICNGNDFYEPLRMKTDDGIVVNYSTREAFDQILKQEKVAQTRTSVPHGNANAVSRPGDVLENIACVSCILASHRNGMGGSSAYDFLLNVVNEWCARKQPVTAWADAAKGALLNILKDLTIPYLSAANCEWDKALQNVDGFYCGTLVRPKNSSQVDGICAIKSRNQTKWILFLEMKNHESGLTGTALKDIVVKDFSSECSRQLLIIFTTHVGNLANKNSKYWKTMASEKGLCIVKIQLTGAVNCELTYDTLLAPQVNAPITRIAVVIETDAFLAVDTTTTVSEKNTKKRKNGNSRTDRNGEHCTNNSYKKIKVNKNKNSRDK